MNTLTPDFAALFASIAYEVAEGEDLSRNEYSKGLNRYFSFENAVIKGVSGSILERVFKHTTPFGCIAKGKPGPFSGDFVLALRGTEKKRDIITDLHCGVSTCANDQPVHAGFNHTFNSLKNSLKPILLMPVHN